MPSKIQTCMMSALLAATCQFAWADPPASSVAPFRTQAAAVHTGVHQGPDSGTIVAFRDTIVVPGAPWLRLRIGEHTLGHRSFLSMRSRQTGAVQNMTATALQNWHNHTAFFGGDALDIELHVAAGEQNIFLVIDEIWVGEMNTAQAGSDDAEPHDLCGTDSRVASTDPRVGRIFGGGCTAFLVANGAFVTAGHCVDQDPDQSGPGLPDGNVDNGFLNTVVEFNVPGSLSNGTPQPAQPEDQFPVTSVYVDYQFDGANDSFNSIGTDWAVFHVGPNADGVTPQQAQGSFFRVRGASSNTVGQTLRQTGYGLDNTPAGPGGCCLLGNNVQFCSMMNCNSSSLTEQTSTGPCTEFEDNGNIAWFRYEVDTTPATSGGPVIREAGGEALGINTNSGCGSGGNWGTTFDQDTLNDSLNDFIWGPGVAYADASESCPLGFCTGTIFNPHPTIPEAVADVANGSTIVIIPGNYTAANGNVLTAGADGKAMTLVAPFGGVVIGN